MTASLEDVLLELQAVAARALQRAHEDHKTPLLNERGLARDGDRCLQGDRSVTVFSGDVNDFKALNSMIGYEAADAVLHAIGTELDRICSPMEASGYRRGGDEFVLLVPSERADAIAVALADRFSPLRVPIPGTGVDVRLSFGYAELDLSEPFKATLDRADDAGKAAKWAIDGRPVRWTEGIATGLHLRVRCSRCRSQFSISVPPGRSDSAAKFACMICGDPLAQADVPPTP